MGPQVSCQVVPLRCFSLQPAQRHRVLPGQQEAFLTFSVSSHWIAHERKRTWTCMLSQIFMMFTFTSSPPSLFVLSHGPQILLKQSQQAVSADQHPSPSWPPALKTWSLKYFLEHSEVGVVFSPLSKKWPMGCRGPEAPSSAPACPPSLSAGPPSPQEAAF